MASNATIIEGQIREALDYLEKNPGATVTQVARDFRIPRTRLYARSRGVPPKVGHPPTNIRLSDAEETALCRYIDGLDRVNLAVQRKFVWDVANFILQKRAPDGTEVKDVERGWVARFIKRYGYNYVP